MSLQLMTAEDYTNRYLPKTKSNESATVQDNSPSTITTPIEIDISEFSEDELNEARKLAPKINVLDYGLVIKYGIEAQMSLSKTSDKILNQSKVKVANSIGSDFEELSATLASLDVNNPSLRSQIGIIARKAIKDLVTNYSRVNRAISVIIGNLEEHQLVIMNDMDVLRELDDAHQLYLKTIALYIYAGQLRIKQIETEELPKLEKNSSISAENAEKCQKMRDALEHFKKRLFDLNVSRTIALQMSAQIHILLLNDSNIIEKINAIIHSTIPLWKNQVAISLGMTDASDALSFESKVTETANNAIRSSSKRIKELTNQIAKQSKQGEVNIDALTKSNQELMETISKAHKIQKDVQRMRNNSESSFKIIDIGLSEKLKKAGGA